MQRKEQILFFLILNQDFYVVHFGKVYENVFLVQRQTSWLEDNQHQIQQE